MSLSERELATADLEGYRHELTDCDRILDSGFEAEDAVQETTASKVARASARGSTAS